MNDLHAMIIGLLQLKGVGRAKVKQLLEMITAPETLLFREIVAIGQTFHLISNQQGQSELAAANDFGWRLLEECAELGIECVSSRDDDFPAPLRFDDGPVLIFYKGNLQILNQPRRAAVIGSRTPTRLGADFAFQAGKILAENHFVVISGLAIGADTAAHRGCLSAGGQTIAFLPSGLIPVYPAANRVLAEKICDLGGCLVSEYHHHETVQPYKFIERDRLQSAASQFVIVSNFASGSGTIHTLEYAHRYHKPIYSIPVIATESRDGFNYLRQKQIAFNILENTELNQIIEIY